MWFLFQDESDTPTGTSGPLHTYSMAILQQLFHTGFDEKQIIFL